MSENPVEISHEIDKFNKEIEELKELLPEAELKYKKEKALFEHDEAKAYMETKLKNTEWAVPMVDKQVVLLMYEKKIKLILTEGEFKKLGIQRKLLDKQLDAIKENSYNMRVEMRR